MNDYVSSQMDYDSTMVERAQSMLDQEQLNKQTSTDDSQLAHGSKQTAEDHGSKDTHKSSTKTARTRRSRKTQVYEAINMQDNQSPPDQIDKDSNKEYQIKDETDNFDVPLELDTDAKQMFDKADNVLNIFR